MPGPSNTEEAAILDTRIEAATHLGLLNVPDPLTITSFNVIGSEATLVVAGTTTGMVQDSPVEVAGCSEALYNGHYRVASYATGSGNTTITIKVPTGGASSPTVKGTVGLWTELTGTAYVRKAINATDWNAAQQGAPTTKTGPKTGVIWAFPQAGSDWAPYPYPVVGWGLYKVSTGGTPFWIGVLPLPTTINTNDNVEFNETNQVIPQIGDINDPF